MIPSVNNRKHRRSRFWTVRYNSENYWRVPGGVASATKLLRWLRADVGVQRYEIIPLAALVELVVITISN